MRGYRIDADRLRLFSFEAFRALGLTPEDAEQSTDVLAYADEHGLDTHGIANLPTIYAPRLLDGRVDAAARPVVASDRGATVVIDARDGLGLVVAPMAMDLSMAKARQFGVGAAAVRRSSHFGAAGYYAARASRSGLIGLAVTNTGRQAIVRPLGGAAPMLGTNPIALAAPAGDAVNFVLDMSTTVVAVGKVRAAASRGTAVPDGWLVDDLDQPVRDPAAYERGTAHLQWLGGSRAAGGQKGYGLGMAVEILAGILAGAGVAPTAAADVRASAGDQDVGHFFLVLDVGAFRPEPEFRRQMDEALGALRNCPPRQPGRPVTYPGHPEDVARAARLRRGVPLDEPTFTKLVNLARMLGIHPPEVRRRTRTRHFI